MTTGGMYVNSAAPSNAPLRVPRPPMTTAESNVNDSTSVNPLGAAILDAIAITAPAAPAHAALTTNARILLRARSIPAISAATSSSRTARHCRPTRLTARLARRKNTRTSRNQDT